MWSVWLVFCDCGFQSVCPPMEKDKRLMEASWWERLTEGKTRKEPDAGKDCRWEEKGTTEDEMVGWHHRLNGHGFGGLREMVMDREAWHAAVHGVTKSRTLLSDWTELKLLRAPSIRQLGQLFHVVEKKQNWEKEKTNLNIGYSSSIEIEYCWTLNWAWCMYINDE